jgi:glycerophosphoryl diester phosphodiesterase
MKMKVIGHRGAAGLELENTLKSIKRALHLGVDGIEVDVRLTKDRLLVLSHDEHLSRISDSSAKINDLTYAELSKIPLENGDRIPLLSEVLEHLKNTEIIIELKDSNVIKELFDVIDKFKNLDITITSFKREELIELKKLRPEQRIYVAALTTPFDIIQDAKALSAEGINLNFWLLNPLTYWQARRANLEITVFTVNNRLLVRCIHLLYPKVHVCTNFPDRFIKKRSKKT